MAGKLSNDYVYIPVETRVSVFFRKGAYLLPILPVFRDLFEKTVQADRGIHRSRIWQRLLLSLGIGGK